jgi:cysteine-rich repeat protein
MTSLRVLTAAVCLVAPAVGAADYGFQRSVRPLLGRVIVPTGGNVVLASTDQGAALVHPESGAILQAYASPRIQLTTGLAWAGTRVLVGTAFTGEDLGNAGAVLEFDALSGVVLRTLQAPAPAEFDRFGLAVATDGARLWVAATECVYAFDAATWALLATIEDPHPDPSGVGIGFGTPLVPLGGSLLVGSAGDTATEPRAGAVHVFEKATSTFLRTIRPAVAKTFMGFGQTIEAVDAGTVLVGAPLEPGGGAVYLMDVASGAELRRFRHPDPLGADQLGRAIAVLGGGLVALGNPTHGVGPFGEDGDTRPSLGAVHVFELATGAHRQMLPNPTPDGEPENEDESFGAALAAAAPFLVVGDPQDLVVPPLPFGGLYVYRESSRCGDGVHDAGEQCDDGNAVDGDGCDRNCRLSGCGNGVRDASEACDDGNEVSGDFCDANCTRSECGNGIAAGDEECDDGGNGAGDGCSPVCRLEVCGNGVLDPTEECDDGNTTPGDACAADCRREARGYFTCYRARAKRGTPGFARRRLVFVDPLDARTTFVLRPIAVCAGDAVEAPAVELVCYRARTPGRTERRKLAVGDALGAHAVRARRVRTVCVPSDGARVFELAHTFPDPFPGSLHFFDHWGQALRGTADRIYVSGPTTTDLGNNRGAIRVFRRDSGALEATIEPPFSVVPPGGGGALGIRGFGLGMAGGGGDLFLVSARAFTSARVAFLWNSSNRTFVRTFVSPSETDAMAAVGDFVLLGDPDDHTATSFAGAVRIFDRNTGMLVHSLFGTESFFGLGRSLAPIGDDVLVTDRQGVHRLSGGSWSKMRSFPEPPGPPDQFRAYGLRLATLGDTVVVAAPSENGQGAVHLFDGNTGVHLRQIPEPGTAGRFSTSLAPAGSAVVVGSPRTDTLAPDAGVVHLYDAVSGERLRTFLNPAAVTSPRFGNVVATAGDDVLVASGGSDLPRADVFHFRNRGLDVLTCYHALRTPGARPAAPVTLWTGDRHGSGPSTLGGVEQVCTPAVHPGERVAGPADRFACHPVDDPTGPAREVVVRNRFGEQTLVVGARERVCLGAVVAALPD